MAPQKSFWETSSLHPFLIALYPLLALWVTNITQIPEYALSRSILLALIFLAFGLGINWLIFRNWNKTAIATSLFMLLFLTYGHVFTVLDMKSIGGFVFGRHRYIFPLWVALMALGYIWIWRTKAIPYNLNRILNLVGLFLVAFSLVQVASFELRTGRIFTQVNTAKTVKASNGTAANMADGPDVYYILVDGYSREDVLKNIGGPDVSGFLNQLTQMGFYVARCSLDNYDYTTVSLSSSMNMDYLDALKVPIHPGEPAFKYDEFENLLQNNRARQIFESMGYQYVTFKGVYDWLNITNSDYYYDFEQATPFYNRLESINFQYLFLSTTMMRPLMEAQLAAPKIFEKLPLPVIELFYPKASVLTSREYHAYQQNLYSLQMLSEVPGLPGKKFVYAHLFLTHPPYTFNPDGTFRWPPLDDDQAYFAQIENANRVLPGLLEKIIKDSKIPPIIILQSDHGYPYTPDRTGILNAYYLPNHGAKDLYPGITPVNSFRYVLDYYFNGTYPLLPDKTYHSDHNWPYRFTPVEPNCPAN